MSEKINLDDVDTSFLIFSKSNQVVKTRWVYCHNLTEIVKKGGDHIGLSVNSKTIFLPSKTTSPSYMEAVRCEKIMKGGGKVVSHCIQPLICKKPFFLNFDVISRCDSEQLTLSDNLTHVTLF